LAATLAANAVSTAYEATLSGPGPRPFAVVAVATVFVLLDLATWAAGRRSSAARQRAEYLEASRAALAAEAVKAERQRIARELHDIVAHSISLIAIQAAGAARVIDRDPARATQSMDSIGRLSQQAINELRRMLTLIEETGSGPVETESAGAGEVPDLLPGVQQLIAEVGDSGHEVALVVTGTPTDLDPSVRLAAHRIAQESLTNAVKHGEPAARIELAVGWTPDHLTLCISNHVTSAGPSETRQFSTGRGLYGLQERARLVGGHLDAGSDQDRFIVAATLPTSVSEALEVS
jgi:signal transduction histidine kinase